jgi:hypothetical protein
VFLLLLLRGYACVTVSVPVPGGPVVERAGGALAATAIAGAGPLPTRRPEPMKEPEPLEVQPDGSSVDALVTALYASLSHGPEYEPNSRREIRWGLVP